MTRPFSAAARGDVLDRLAQRTYDVLVVGGGITGVGIALDAATRGLRVALVERDDLAAGTSSRSSSLVHGGLRYLAKGHLGLVRESVAERELLRRLAPHLVTPLPFVLPRSGRQDARLLGAGLSLYDTLAAGRGGRHRRLTPAELRRDVPGLVVGADTGGWRYGDCRTDDARLVLAVARAAHRLGVEFVTRAEVTELRRAGGRVVGATVHDRLGGGEIGIAARATISATGVWADAVRGLAGPSPLRLRPSKGVHLVFPATLVRTTAAVVLPAPHGRSVFCLPWDGQVVVGTTDDAYEGPLDAPAVEAADASYLCDAVNAAFALDLGPGDAVAAWAGLRPLLAGGPGADVDALSRRHALAEDPDGLVTITGGKLTTYRRMAADAVDRVAASLGARVASATATVPLGLRGGVAAAVGRVRDLCEAAGVDSALAGALVARHGHDAGAVVALAAATGETARLVPGLDYLAAEVRWAARAELACGVEDVLSRRLRVARRDAAGGGADVAEQVAAVLTDEGVPLADDASSYRRRLAAERGVVPLAGVRVETRGGG